MKLIQNRPRRVRATLCLLAVVLVAATPETERAAGMAGNMRMLTFTAVISLATGILFGLGPLVGTGRTAAGESLRQGRRVAGASHSHLRNGLAVLGISAPEQM